MVLKRTCLLWKLDVLAIALTPSSIASKPLACQSRQRVRSDPKRQKPPFAHRMYSFFAEACRLRSVKLFFTEPCSRRDRSFFLLLSSLVCHFRFAPFAPRDNSFRFQAYTQHHLAFRILQLSDVGRTVTVLNCVLQFSRASLRIKFPSSQSVALCLFFVTWTQQCVCGLSIGGSLFLSNLQLAALTF